ncbi:SusC/RagA family TonB-linked outer membrane protein, partial [Xanthovirga aplysinae]|uniref:SusC/RagA family TonB-linked outer membrane protein n=1 Tax=Xanthovirga aplysinae TaxID=2529853 RepID=UPI0012BB9690
WAQDQNVSGVVTSEEDGLGLPGVNVVIKGTSNGVLTDFDGKYSVSVPEGGTLVFSFVGMVTQEIEVGSKSIIDVALASDVKQLEDVVVTAIGIEKEKRTLGYAVQNVDANDLRNAQESNLVNALAGKVAGVQINSSGGQAGSSSRITIRGSSSLTGSNQPLFVVDGVPMNNSENVGNPNESTLFNGTATNRIADIDPNNIADMSVLKGAAATALYGSRGANGVIMITTKRGSSNKPTINVSSKVGVSEAIISGYQNSYLQGNNGLYRNGLPEGQGGYAEEEGANPQTTTSWGPHKDQVSQAVIDAIGMPQVYDPREEFFRTGLSLENNINLSGGKENLTYYMSYSNLDEKGIAPGNEFIRNSFNTRLDGKLSDKLTYAGSLTYTNSQNDRLPEGNGSRSYMYNLFSWPISQNINNYLTEDGEQYAYSASRNNPFWLVDHNLRRSVVDRFFLTQTFTYEIAPWLKVSNVFGYDTYTDQTTEETDIGTVGAPDGRMSTGTIKNQEYNNDLLFIFNKDLSDKINLNGIVGGNLNVRNFHREFIWGQELSIPGFFDISNASSVNAFEFDSQYRQLSAFAQATLEYDDMVFLNVSGRNDWSSSLPLDARSFFYPSVSLGFDFTRALGISDNNILSYGKIRTSWAQAGNTADPYGVDQTFEQVAPGDGVRGTISVPTQGYNGFLINNTLANNFLTHELTTEKEIGADLRFFNGRLGVDFTYYDKVTDDQIIPAPTAPSVGYTSQVLNVGEVQNKGIELTLTGTPVDMKNGFRWDIQLNYAKNKTVVNELAEGVESIFMYGFTSPQIRADVENGYGVIWGQPFARTEDGQLIIGEDGLPTYADELGVIGQTQPDWTGGIRNTFSYKGLTLSALFDARMGGDIMNMDLYYASYYGTPEVTEDRGSKIVWEGVTADGQPNTKEVTKDQAYYQNFYSSSDELFVEDGSFVKLRELSLSYNLPSKWLKKTPFQAVSFSATGRNLFIWSNFSYWDPEGNLGGNGNGQGFYHAVTPGTRSYSFGLNVTL